MTSTAVNAARLILPSSLATRLRALARRAAPEECCGFLVGQRAPVPTVTSLHPAANIHAEPRRFFTIDPARHFALLRDLRAQEKNPSTAPRDILLGHYHSHPQGNAAPSARDLADADDPDLIWLIIAADSGAIGGFMPETGDSGRVVAFAALTIDIVAPENP